jgi:chemotaxis protein methyltransferase CheR
MTQTQFTRTAFSDAMFDRIRQFMHEKTGVVLNDAKKDMVFGRLYKHITLTGLSSFATLCDALEAGDVVQQNVVINAITTNLTSFYRERHHFDFLSEQVIQDLMEANSTTRRIRIWSAGCSSGEEAYSIAMCLLDKVPALSDWDIKILATDVDLNMLAQAKTGVYAIDRLEGISPELRKRWFRKGQGRNQQKVKIKEDLKQFVRVKYLNLLESWPMEGPFDIIFCRNVVIYFDKNTRQRLFDRFANILTAEGHLFIGHSENLFDISKRFRPLGQTVYQKKGN